MNRRLALVAALLLAIGAVACQPRLGSSTNGFGNQLAGDVNGDGDGNDPGECINPQGACAGTQPLFWGATNNPSFGRAQGDPFSATCDTGTSCAWTPANPNPERRTTGYLYGVEVAEAGQTVTVEIYDAPAIPTSSSTGDTGSFPVQYELFADDGDDLTTSTDPALSLAGLCTTGPGRRGFPGGYNPTAARLQNRWWTLCSFTAPAAGVYPLQVRVADISADPTTGVTACTTRCTQALGGSGGGTVTAGANGYALRATTSTGVPPRTFAVGDMSTYIGISSTTGVIDLVEVPEFRAGDRMLVDLFDPGDVAGTGQMELEDPEGTAPPCTLGAGTITGRRTDPPVSTTDLSTGCHFFTSTSGTSLYNSKWVRLTVEIPESYTCASDCWWHLRSTVSSNSTDRVTVAVNFEDLP